MTKKTAALVGFAPASRMVAPFENEEITIFGINEEYSYDWFKRKSGNLVWVQLHSRELITRDNNHNDPHHWEWLQKEHPFPIYMQEKYDDIPSSVKFPINEIRDRWRGDNGWNYYTSTLAYLLVLAEYLGYKRMELYGFEMASGTEYAYQRACACYWIGKLRGKGIEVYLPPQSDLLVGAPYAYDSSFEIGYSQELDFKAGSMKKKQEENIDKYNMARGEFVAIQNACEFYPELGADLDKYESKAKKFALDAKRYEGYEHGIKMARKVFTSMMKTENGARNA